MLTQAQIAAAWGEDCYHGAFLTVTFNGGGRASIRPAIADAAAQMNQCFKVWGYETDPSECGGYACRHKTGSNEVSNHGRGIAIDIQWRTNPYGKTIVTDMPLAMVQAVCAIRTNVGDQVWNNGRFWSGNKDPMHFEIVCTPGSLLSGINMRTVPGSAPPAPLPPLPPLPPETVDKETLIMRFLNSNGHGAICLYILGDTLKVVPCTGHALGEYQNAGVPSLSLTLDEINNIYSAYGLPPT